MLDDLTPADMNRMSQVLDLLNRHAMWADSDDVADLFDAVADDIRSEFGEGEPSEDDCASSVHASCQEDESNRATLVGVLAALNTAANRVDRPADRTLAGWLREISIGLGAQCGVWPTEADGDFWHDHWPTQANGEFWKIVGGMQDA